MGWCGWVCVIVVQLWVSVAWDWVSVGWEWVDVGGYMYI